MAKKVLVVGKRFQHILSAFDFQIFASYLFKSREAIAEAVIGLLLFFISSRLLLRPYDVTTSSSLLFAHSFVQFQLNCVHDVIFHSLKSEFFVHSRVEGFGNT